MTEGKVFYKIKWIEYFNRVVPVLQQNENGPCPLLAIANVLFLRGGVTVNRKLFKVSNVKLVATLREFLLVRNEEGEEWDENKAKVITDVMDMLPSLETGMDVNLRFGSVSDFEFNAELSVFDVFGIRLFHGWLPDPELDEGGSIYDILRNMSYNQALDHILAGKAALEKDDDQVPIEDKREIFNEIESMELFFENHSNQLTFYGLQRLHQDVPEAELCVLFRNNHFSVMIKQNNEIYLLMTSEAYLTEPAVAWERLDDVSGNTTPVSPVFGPLEEYQDYLLARELHFQQNYYPDRKSGGGNRGKRGKRGGEKTNNKKKNGVFGMFSRSSVTSGKVKEEEEKNDDANQIPDSSDQEKE